MNELASRGLLRPLSFIEDARRHLEDFRANGSRQLAQSVVDRVDSYVSEHPFLSFLTGAKTDPLHLAAEDYLRETSGETS